MAYLVLVRHGLSEFNKQGLWTGRRNPELAPEGLKDAQAAASSLHDIKFDYAFSSKLLRHVKTLEIILEELNQRELPVSQTDALIERDYGIYTGKNKWEIKNELGETEFNKLRRSWDFPVPEGESLKDVSERVIVYFNQEVMPLLSQNKNVIVSSSGNVLRTIVKHLEDIPDEKINTLEIAPGTVYVYEMTDGKIINKEIRNNKENVY